MNTHQILTLAIPLYLFIVIVFLVYYMDVQIVLVKDETLLSGGIVKESTEIEMTDEDAICILNKGLEHNLIYNKILEVAEKVEFTRMSNYRSIRNNYRFYYKNYIITCDKLYCDEHLIFESIGLSTSLMEIYCKKQKDLLYKEQQKTLRCLEKE